MTETIYVRFRLRGRTAAEWTLGDEVLLDREMGVETDTKKFKFGDGVTLWNSLPYAALTTADLGITVQGYHANLAALAALTLVADRLPYANGTGTLALATFTALGRSLVGAASTLIARAALLLGPSSAADTWDNAQAMPGVNLSGGSNLPRIQRRAFGGYPAYDAIVIGGQGNTSVAFVDVNGVAGGTFFGNGNELIVGDAFSITAVNPAGTDFIQRVLSFPSGVFRGRSFTVSGLPSAATVGDGARAYVSDATVTTFASVVAGGGSNAVPVYSDGSNWRIG